MINQKISIFGLVQGVGFRPFIYNLALKYNIKGWIKNDENGVEILAFAKKEDLIEFIKELRLNPPTLAKIIDIKIENLEFKEYDKFEIEKSSNSNIKNKSALIYPDISICEDCIKDIFDKSSFRYNYALTNCTNCGPRYSIIKDIPYDRVNTSLKEFSLCKNCQDEFENPKNRRYHAQAISCEGCGPTTFLYDKNQNLISKKIEAINQSAKLIEYGKILAIKGVGGFHIVCDATNSEVIKKIRDFKKRATKPFAIMFKDIENLKKYAIFEEFEEKILSSNSTPIVLLKKRKNSDLSEQIAPNLDVIGSFLPNSALHYLLFKNLNKPILATSANLKDEPIITKKDDIFSKLCELVDFVLDYNRDIVNSCDDSVLQVIGKRVVKLRNSRAFAPNILKVDRKFSKKVLSLGANQKATFSIAFNDKIITSPYLGELNSIDTIEHYKKTIKDFICFYDFKPEVIVCDKHPNYESTKIAFEFLKQNPNLNLIQIQHHYSHVLAVLAENSIKEDVLAFVFDGTGYGDDKNIWGGEVFIANQKEYRRAYHLKYFKLLGADLAIKEPRRVALSLLFDNFSLEEVLALPLELLKTFEKNEIKILYKIWQKGLNSPFVSSFARVFDAISSFADLLHYQSYEAEAALLVESLYSSDIEDSFSYEIVDGIIDISSMIKELVLEKEKRIIVSKFINTVSAIIFDISNLHKDLPIVLSGGVFQNRTLLEILFKKLEGRRVYLGEKYSPNDENISLGQAYFNL